MNRIAGFLYRIFYWTYERGSWQWDLCCLGFLLVIFLTPRDLLESYARNPLSPDQIRRLFIASFTDLF